MGRARQTGCGGLAKKQWVLGWCLSSKKEEGGRTIGRLGDPSPQSDVSSFMWGEGVVGAGNHSNLA